ncbi:hypothetical protein [Candidatus Symbiobacter mobilis]|uniref:hypothetical protein n=1 Tax=Candidatus Symbiobacter mobilis TaxID=1436290 RepID=UPI001EE64A69|nr:hypothetical protein [Candidatus Symbiobacter mobilis]
MTRLAVASWLAPQSPYGFAGIWASVRRYAQGSGQPLRRASGVCPRPPSGLACFAASPARSARLPPSAKTATLTFRIELNIKEALCTAADRDHRSIANMVAVMIREHCACVGIPIQEKQAAPEPEAAKPKPRKR